MAEELQIFASCRPAVALSNVAGDRDRGAPHLIRQTKLLRRGKLGRVTINLSSQFNRPLPNDEIFERRAHTSLLNRSLNFSKTIKRPSIWQCDPKHKSSMSSCSLGPLVPRSLGPLFPAPCSLVPLVPRSLFPCSLGPCSLVPSVPWPLVPCLPPFPQPRPTSAAIYT